MQLVEETRLGAGSLRTEAESGCEELEELGASECGIREVHDPDVVPAVRFQGGAYERGLSGSRFANEDGHAGTARKAIAQMRERLAMASREEQKMRIRRQIE